MADPQYATLDELKARWRGHPTGVDDYMTTLLVDASVMLAAELPAIVADESKEPALRIVVCNMVKRAMAHEGDDGEDIPYGTKQSQDTAGSFTETRTFESPAGSMYIWPSDRKLLGVTAQRSGGVDMLRDPDVIR